MVEERQDTNPGMDLQQAILDELQKIRRGLEGLNDRVGGLEERVEQVVRDLNTVHMLQRTFTQRMGAIEQLFVDTPLETAKTPSSPPPTRKISAVPDGKR